MFVWLWQSSYCPTTAQAKAKRVALSFHVQWLTWKTQNFSHFCSFEIGSFHVTFPPMVVLCLVYKNGLSFQVLERMISAFRLKLKLFYTIFEVLLWKPSYSPTLWQKHLFDISDLHLLSFLRVSKFPLFFFLDLALAEQVEHCLTCEKESTT